MQRRHWRSLPSDSRWPSEGPPSSVTGERSVREVWGRELQLFNRIQALVEEKSHDCALSIMMETNGVLKILSVYDRYGSIISSKKIIIILNAAPT